jgi:ketopantoate reductase
MRQDLRKNSERTEIDDLNGALVALAEKHHLPCPANQELCALIKNR